MGSQRVGHDWATFTFSTFRSSSFRYGLYKTSISLCYLELKDMLFSWICLWKYDIRFICNKEEIIWIFFLFLDVKIMFLIMYDFDTFYLFLLFLLFFFPLGEKNGAFQSIYIILPHSALSHFYYFPNMVSSVRLCFLQPGSSDQSSFI